MCLERLKTLNEGRIEKEEGREERQICVSVANRSDDVKQGPGNILQVDCQEILTIFNFKKQLQQKACPRR